jgi:hypothetical protein
LNFQPIEDHHSHRAFRDTPAHVRKKFKGPAEAAGIMGGAALDTFVTVYREAWLASIDRPGCLLIKFGGRIQ